MTATPHSGKEEDFQLFLALLDRDRFEGKYREGVARRRRLGRDAPHGQGGPAHVRRQAAVPGADRRTPSPYELTELEARLYEQVTTYVREEMNRADEARRQAAANTVGFALTVLQRRLASCPEAIYQSLERRARAPRAPQAGDARRPAGDRRAARRADPSIRAISTSSTTTSSPPRSSRALEEELVDRGHRGADGRGARRRDRRPSRDLEGSPRGCGHRTPTASGQSCRTILQDNTSQMLDAGGERRKLIIFTEHRDTLNYLAARIAIAARPARGGRRDPRRRAPRRAAADHRRSSRSDPDVLVLLATDAAGEGLNLQRAHLMVNYDLPWNPNRHRAALRPHPPHRPERSATCGTSSPTTPARARSSSGCWRSSRSSARRYGGKVFDVLGRALQRDAAARPADRGDPLRRAARGQGAAGRRSIDAGVGRRARGAARRARAGRATRCSTPTSPHPRAMMERGRGAAPAAALHRGRFFLEAFTRLGGKIRRARAGPLRDHPRPGAAAHAIGDGPVRRSPLRARHLRQASTSRDDGPAARRVRSPRPPAARRRDRRDPRALPRPLDAAPSSSRRRGGPRRLLVVRRAESPTPTETAVARRLGDAVRGSTTTAPSRRRGRRRTSTASPPR